MIVVVLTKLEVWDPGKVRGLIVPTFGSMFCITKLKSYYTNFWSRTYCQKIYGLLSPSGRRPTARNAMQSSCSTGSCLDQWRITTPLVSSVVGWEWEHHIPDLTS